MKMPEFIQTYCKDLLANHVNNSKLVEWNTLPHSDVIEDEDGKPTAVVYIDSEPVPVKDFFEYNKTDFTSIHNTPSAGEMYDNYLSSFEILEGDGAVDYYRKRVKQDAERIQQNLELYDLIT